MKGRPFDVLLAALTPSEFVFLGEQGQKSVYRRDNIRSMIDRGEADSG
jgi:hypothetical protein